jgi:sugar lactone lactonase YvrE
VNKLVAAIVVVTLCACSNGSSYAPGSGYSPASRTTSAQRHRIAPIAYVAEVCQHANNNCKPPGGLIETLDGTSITNGIADPWSLAFDATGDLYVGNQNGTNPTGFVTEYAPGSTSPLRTINNLGGTPRALAIDTSNNVFVIGNAKAGCCNFAGFGSVYGSTGNKKLWKLAGIGSFPGRPAFDAEGNLYVPNFETFPGDVTVYPPGAKKPSRAIQNGIGFPKALAFDSSGNLYVLNNTLKHGSNVTVYAPGSGNVMRTIDAGMKTAYTMVLDPHDNVYVANDEGRGVPNAVLVYSAGTNALLRTITTGVKYPVGLAFDSNGDLLVANAPRRGKNTVTMYPPGTSEPSQTYQLKESPTAIVAASPQ